MGELDDLAEADGEEDQRGEGGEELQGAQEALEEGWAGGDGCAIVVGDVVVSGTVSFG